MSGNAPQDRSDSDDVRTLRSGFLSSCERHPDRVAIEVAGEKLRYVELRDRAARIALEEEIADADSATEREEAKADVLLLKAVKKDNRMKALKALVKGASPNARGDSGTALYQAVKILIIN